MGTAEIVRPRIAGGRGSPAPAVLRPAVPPFAVRRQRLLNLLDLTAHQRMTLVVAPPGYGKTVLLAQWAAEQPAPAVRWLTLTPAANEDGAFARELEAALDPTPRAPTTVVLDDFQFLTDPVALEDFAAYVEHAPRTVHVVIATRIDPPLPYYRLRLSDALVELRQDDLAFTADEAGELIRRLSGRSITDEQVEVILSRTEGWAAGLQLAALSLSGQPATDEFVETFAVDDSLAADYLAEEVLRCQPEGVRRFLLTTSVLERMCGSLCDAVTRDSDGHARLEAIDRTSLFITRLDARRHWFRYHPLFRSLLRHRLHTEAPELEERVLRRAAAWHLARDEVEAGVGYLVEAEAWEEVLDIAARRGAAMLDNGEVASVARWIERVPPGYRQQPRVLLLEAAARLVGADTARADDALRYLGTLRCTPAERAVADLLCAYQAAQQGESAVALAAADRVQRAVEHIDADDLPDILGLTSTKADLAAAARVTRGIALLYRGDLLEGRRQLDPVIEGVHAMWQVTALGALAMVTAWSGRLAAGEHLGARALVLARQLGTDRQPITADAYLALAHVARERGAVERATRMIDEAAKRLGPSPRRAIAALVVSERALLALEQGDPAAGLSTLAVRRLGDAARSPFIRAYRKAVEARLLLELAAFDGAARALGPVGDDETASVAAMRVRLAAERGDRIAAAEALERWPEAATPRSRLDRAVWAAVLDHLAGVDRAASDGIAAVVADAEPEGNVGLFRAAGPLVLGPLRTLQRTAPTPFVRELVDGAPGPAGRVGDVTALDEQPTDREYAVLALLPTRLSNAEIAARLGVSLNTVKTHLKHIYRKFGVTGRREAVDRAERLGLA